MDATNTTLFDLNQSASTAAVTALGKDALGIESLKLEAFTAAGHAREDFEQWGNYFGAHLTNFTVLQKVLSPGAKAAMAAAAAAAKTTATSTN